jgi:hypothetical protein
MPIPLLIAGAALGVGAAAAAKAGGVGENKTKANSFQSSNEGYRKDAFQYGGREGVADAMAARYRGEQRQANHNAGVYQGQQAQMYGAGRAGMHNALEARGDQQTALAMMQARAMGHNSIAQQQATRDMQQAAAAQSSQAASARGPGGLALAQGNAAANTAMAQQGISGQAQINAAQERMMAEQAYFGGASGMRGQDYAGAQTAFGAGAQSGQLGLGQQQIGLGYQQAEMGVLGAQTQAQMAHQNMLAQSHAQAQATRAGIAQNNANNDMALFQMGLGAASGGMGAAGGAGGGGPPMYSDDRTKLAAAWDEGRDSAMQHMAKLSSMPPEELKRRAADQGRDDSGMAWLVSQSKADAWDEGHGAPRLPPTRRTEPRAVETLAAHGPWGLEVEGVPTGSAKVMARDPGGHPVAPPEQMRAAAPVVVQRPERISVARQEPAAAGLGSFFSDERAKTERAKKDMTAALSDMEPHSYEYKPGFGKPGRNVGPMAQEMLRNPVTGTAVEEDPETGLLTIDRDKGLKLALAASGHLADRVAKLEGRKKR